jgi:hypothetical protein
MLDLNEYIYDLNAKKQLARPKRTVNTYEPKQKEFIVNSLHKIADAQTFCLKERAWDDGYIVREDKLIDFLRSKPLKTGVRVKGRR